jgi:hypothetical protein
MSTKTLYPCEITKDELLDLTATKLADQFSDLPEITERAQNLIGERVKELFESSLKNKIDAFLVGEMEKLISQEIHPVDMWGEKTGKPTTIKAQLAIRARDFWDLKVDEQGKESSYGGQPRHQYLLKKVAREEFEKAVRENIEEMVSAFKEAVRADAVKMATEHIDKLITLRK